MRLEPPFAAYLAPEGFTDELCREIGDVAQVFGRLVVASGAPKDYIWAENTWRNPRFIPIDSIGDAAKKLRGLQRNWAHYPHDFHRRSRLIAEKLPHVSAKPLVFPHAPPQAPLGSWTLVEDNLLLAAPDCSSPVPNGAYVFEEDKEGPPSRAYLKLWEALTRIGKMPQTGETCLDLGACPGGWTWVLQSLGARVISVDKAPLAPSVAALPRVEYRAQSAFALAPADIGPVDWLFSDIICYPERLFTLVKAWRESKLVKNFVTTIKFQGDTDYKTTQNFLEISGSRVLHLYNNKHEITWVCLEK